MRSVGRSGLAGAGGGVTAGAGALAGVDVAAVPDVAAECLLESVECDWQPLTITSAAAVTGRMNSFRFMSVSASLVRTRFISDCHQPELYDIRRILLGAAWFGNTQRIGAKIFGRGFSPAMDMQLFVNVHEMRAHGGGTDKKP